MEKVFGPFVSGDETGQSVGLGLTAAKAIVEQFKGSIGLESVATEGTLVRINF